jgi:hypothetical protein
MDDTIVNITNLMQLIRRLNHVYDPRRELIFRGFRNNEYRKRHAQRRLFLGGGSGWLMSRPMVEVHRLPEYSLHNHWAASFRGQDDTAEAMIVQKLFRHSDAWAESLHFERCFNCRGSRFEAGDWSGINNCPRRPTFAMNSIVSFHPASDDESMKAGMMIGRYPPNIHYFHVRRSIGSFVCFKVGWKDYHEPLAIFEEHITLNMLPWSDRSHGLHPIMKKLPSRKITAINREKESSAKLIKTPEKWIHLN